MKTFLAGFFVILGFWFAGLTVVHAEIKPLPPDYDPIQGGMVLRPPHDLWIKADNITSMIPIAYLPGGAINADQLKQLNYFVEVNGKMTPVQRVSSSAYMDDKAILGWKLGQADGNSLGLVVRANRVGVYALKLLMQFGQSTEQYETEVTLHVVNTISAVTWAETSSKYILSPLPQLVIWHHLDGEVTIENAISPDINNNELKWPIVPLFTLIPPTTTSSSGDTKRTFGMKLTTGTRELIIKDGQQTQSVTAHFGVPVMTVYKGQPIKLDLDYMHPNPGTKLEFIWQFYNVSGVLLTQSTPTPEFPAELVPPNVTLMQLTLQYSDSQTIASFSSTIIRFVYKSSSLLKIPPAEATVNLPAIIEGPTTANAGLTDWSVNQVGPWHFTITASTLKQTDGTTLPARLQWPDGTRITPNQPFTINYSGQQVVPLSQIDWVFQQQTTAKAGHYQAELLFEAIAGP